MKTIKLLALLGLFLFVAETAMAAEHYIRAGSTGSSPCSDWSKACNDLPATLVRGDTYYIADGSYNGYDFNTAASGSLVITIKKATIADHGTSTGWLSTYGDSQAIFGRIVFSTSYWTFDGISRNSSNWLDTTGYGFVVAGGVGGYDAKLIHISTGSNITVRNVYAYFNSVLTGGDVSANWSQGLYSVNGSTNVTMEYCLIKNTSYKAAILINDTSGPITIRYNQFENIYKKELFSARRANNVTYAFNAAKNIAGTGALIADSCSNWDIYGNTFWSPDANYSFTDSIMGTWTGDAADKTETLNNWKIYNNTFYQMNGASQIEIQHGTGNVVSNNLFIGFTSNIHGSLTESYNTQNALLSVVTNASGGNFTLTSATSTGTSLASPYNIDFLGKIRGSDGTWDRGACEFGGNTTNYSGSHPSSPVNLQIL